MQVSPRCATGFGVLSFWGGKAIVVSQEQLLIEDMFENILCGTRIHSNRHLCSVRLTVGLVGACQQTAGPPATLSYDWLH